MSNFNEGLTRRAIVHLVFLYTNFFEQPLKTKKRDVAYARYYGFAYGLHFLLQHQGMKVGASPDSITLDFHDVLNDLGEPPQRGLAFNSEYNEWQAKMTGTLLTRWSL